MSSKYFIPGDLLHIPQGTILYSKIRHTVGGPSPVAMPIKFNGSPTVALVIEKDIKDFYLISIKNEEYLVLEDSVSLYNEELKHVY